MDPATITAAIAAASAGVSLIDKMYDQVVKFVTKRDDTAVPSEHRMKIEQTGTALVAKYHGQVTQTITAADFNKLPEAELEHIVVLEQSMRKHYRLWAAVYPNRDASPDLLANAKTEQQLADLVAKLREDLNGILGFLTSLGLRLDDHYMNIRDVVNQQAIRA